MKALVAMTLANLAMFVGASYMYFEQPALAYAEPTDESMCMEVENVEIESAAPTHFIVPNRNRLMCEQ